MGGKLQTISTHPQIFNRIALNKILLHTIPNRHAAKHIPIGGNQTSKIAIYMLTQSQSGPLFCVGLFSRTESVTCQVYVSMGQVMSSDFLHGQLKFLHGQLQFLQQLDCATWGAQNRSVQSIPKHNRFPYFRIHCTVSP